MPLTPSMIRMVRKDRRGAKQLLGQHRADQQVRPGRWSKGQKQLGIFPLRSAMAVSGTDQESRLALSSIAPLSELFGEPYRRKRLSALIQRDRHRAGCGIR